jgi:adrenodoxin-NADP+ reductase
LEGFWRSFNLTKNDQNEPGLYVSGWLKTGPVGVIASTMYSAFETADSILDDVPKLAGVNLKGLDALPESIWLKRTTWNDWLKIDQVERERGGLKPREKITSVDEMLKVIKS